MYCAMANKDPDGRVKSDQLTALAEDHLNDVISNSSAICTLALALHTPAVSDVRVIILYCSVYLKVCSVFN